MQRNEVYRFDSAGSIRRFRCFLTINCRRRGVLKKQIIGVWRPVRKGPPVATAMNQAAVMIKHDFELDNHPSGELLQRQWWDAEVVDFEAEGDNFDASSPRGGDFFVCVSGTS